MVNKYEKYFKKYSDLIFSFALAIRNKPNGFSSLKSKKLIQQRICSWNILIGMFQKKITKNLLFLKMPESRRLIYSDLLDTRISLASGYLGMQLKSGWEVQATSSFDVQPTAELN